ncbi:hypothetical protein B0H15DRAFT_952754 [Mycena belliarum]|uniref:Uncharacterized protein n=1 Tax=Mycena belliarum TaxID=1033014 RepID=A0AAD6TYI4_9AGAR|nr:hypothetical protein B0H15DRAFT_958668 [Mycena belliae]KAJ7082078.1 hypothetical protein B0H15DRAFT_952754 [Mycena belliae]
MHLILLPRATASPLQDHAAGVATSVREVPLRRRVYVRRRRAALICFRARRRACAYAGATCTVAVHAFVRPSDDAPVPRFRGWRALRRTSSRHLYRRAPSTTVFICIDIRARNSGARAHEDDSERVVVAKSES